MTVILKIVALALWLCASVVASGYAVVAWQLAQNPGSNGTEAKKATDYVKPRSVSVPVILNGSIQGYVIAQFVFRVDVAAVKSFGQKPDPIFADEAFRSLYAVEGLDLTNLRKQDIAALTKDMAARLNKRLGLEMVREVLLQELNYVAREEARGAKGSAAR